MSTFLPDSTNVVTLARPTSKKQEDALKFLEMINTKQKKQKKPTPKFKQEKGIQIFSDSKSIGETESLYEEIQKLLLQNRHNEKVIKLMK